MDLPYENTCSGKIIKEGSSYDIMNYALTLVYLDYDPTLDGFRHL